MMELRVDSGMAGMCLIMPRGGTWADRARVPGSGLHRWDLTLSWELPCRCLARCPVPVTLTAAERKTLKKRARGAKTPYRDRLRAQIVLAAACGRDNARIARGLGVAV